MTTRPGYVWDATASEWVEIGQAAVLAPVKYQATAPSSPATGDIWIESDVDVPSIDSSVFYRWKKTAVGGETTLSGTDDAGLLLKYTVGYEELYINGVLQVRSSDYVATTGTTITGLTALVAGDIITIMSQVAYALADTYTQTQVNALLLSTNPVGAVTSYAGSTAPSNWLLCDGSEVSRTTYASLFSVISTTYGIGNGSTTFNLPNLKGRIPVGRDSAQTEFDTLAEIGGAKTHTLTIPEMPSHRHAFSVFGDPGSGNIAPNDSDNPPVRTGYTSYEGGDQPHNNLQPYIVLNYIIKVA